MFRRDPKQGGKIGGAPGGWIAAETQGYRFEVAALYADPLGSPYAHNNCGREIWSNPDPLKYMELELLGPVHTLKPGERVGYTTRWRLRQISQRVAASRIAYDDLLDVGK